jgi:excisionase family DNA binding protein
MQTRTIREVAEILTVSPGTIYTLCAKGKFAHLRVSTSWGTIRIREDELAAFISAATVQQDQRRS